MNAPLDKFCLSAAIDAVFLAVSKDRALLAGPSPLTYGDLHTRMKRLQAVYNHYHLKAGDRVAIVSRDDPSVISLYFAAIRAGLVAVICDGHSTIDEVGPLMEIADPALAFIDLSLLQAGLAGTLAEQEVPTIAIGDNDHAASPDIVSKLLGRSSSSPASTRGLHDLPHLLGEFEPAEFSPPASDDAVAHILFTSGTTSPPKGVEITHGNIKAQLATFKSVYGYDEQSRILNVLPLHHTDGLTQGPIAAFFAGGSVHRPCKFRVQALPELLDSIISQRITHFIVVPAMLALIMRLGEEYRDSLRESDLRVVRSSADLLDPDLWSAFEERFGIPVANAYGLTETVCEALYCGPDTRTRRIGTIGMPIDCKARLVDENGHDVPAGEVGELWLCGANIMKGYFRDPDETGAVLTDGWYHTGDLMCRDDDAFYRIVGRTKTVIITGGVNVHPEAVSSAIRNLKGVTGAVTLGSPDPVWGEIVVCCVVATPESGLDETALMAHCRATLAEEMVPVAIFLVDALPMGPAGKVQMNELRAMVTDRLAGKPTTKAGLHDEFFGTAAKAFNVPISTLSVESTPFNTNGWDSLAHMRLVAGLEEHFGLTLSAAEIVSLHSLEDALRIVRHHNPSVGEGPADLSQKHAPTENQEHES